MIQEYLIYLRDNKSYSDKTIKAYNNCLCQFVKYMSAKGFRWSTISQKDIISYLAYLNQCSKASSTIIQHIAAIRGIYRWMAKRYDIANPAMYIQSPKKKSLIPHIVNLEDIKRVLIAEKDEEIKLGVAIMAFSGLRVSELLNMRYEDIDKSTGRVLIVGKGNKERYVYIHRSVLPLLRKGQGYLISYEDRAFRYRVYLAFRNIGVYCSCHMLRHTFATMAVDNGMRLDVLRDLLGHTSVATTQIYLHSAPKVVQEEFNKYSLI